MAAVRRVAVPRRRLLVAVDDDGQTVTLVVHRFDLVGTVEIGPIPVADSQRLSFPEGDVDQWQRDMIVQVLELL